MSTELDNLQFAEGNFEIESKETSQLSDNLIVENKNLQEYENEHFHTEIPEKEYEALELDQLYDEIQALINKFQINQVINSIRKIQEIVKSKLAEDKLHKEQEFNSSKTDENQEFNYDFIWEKKFKQIFYDVKRRTDLFYQEREKQLIINLEKRKNIIENLRELYSNPSDSTQYTFKKFREIKSNWLTAGTVPKKDVENIFRTYYHHLDNFYTYIKLNKELQTLDHVHNLEQRKNIINRAKELVNEPNLFKALNELQYLHKLWKEEGEPVDDQHKETTWQEFKSLTNLIHDRKNEWFEEIKKVEDENFKIKSELINKLQTLIQDSKNIPHKIWQNKIQEIESIRSQFLEIGKVPKEKTNEIWSSFKNALRDFNHAKNNFYKELKHEQNENLKKKNELIKIAKENNESEDWAVAIELFKKIQNDWSKIGHVPKKISDQKWFEFKEACNYFFDRYRNRFKEENAEFKQNLILKKSIIEELDLIKSQEITEDKNTIIEKLRELNHQWNSIGKVPRENMNINRIFSKVSKDILTKLELSNQEQSQISIEMQYDTIINTHNEKKLDEEIRKLRKQIQDLEQEITILDNNLSFFGNANRNNPLVKDSFDKLERKNKELSQLKNNYNALVRLDVTENTTH